MTDCASTGSHDSPVPATQVLTRLDGSTRLESTPYCDHCTANYAHLALLRVFGVDVTPLPVS